MAQSAKDCHPVAIALAAGPGPKALSWSLEKSERPAIFRVGGRHAFYRLTWLRVKKPLRAWDYPLVMTNISMV